MSEEQMKRSDVLNTELARMIVYKQCIEKEPELNIAHLLEIVYMMGDEGWRHWLINAKFYSVVYACKEYLMGRGSRLNASLNEGEQPTEAQYREQFRLHDICMELIDWVQAADKETYPS